MIPARVLVSYGSHGVIQTDTDIISCQWRRGKGRPLCGDWIQVSLTQDGSAALEAIHDRHSEFQRGDARGRPQLIAANIDQVVVVTAPKPAPSDFMVDRYLVAIQAMSLKPLLVLNKYDLIELSPQLPQHLQAYETVGVKPIQTSTKQAPGTSALKAALHNQVSILVGQSGTGKSSLINALVPDREQQTGALSKATGKGRHTTTRTAWISLPDGGAVVDSPGVWEYGLWHMQAATVAHCFPDFLDYLGRCRFRDCSHRHEPDCALRTAISAGEINPRRLQAYHNILEMQRF